MWRGERRKVNWERTKEIKEGSEINSNKLHSKQLRSECFWTPFAVEFLREIPRVILRGWLVRSWLLWIVNAIEGDDHILYMGKYGFGVQYQLILKNAE